MHHKPVLINPCFHYPLRAENPSLRGTLRFVCFECGWGRPLLH